MTNVPKIKVDLTNPKDYLDRIMTDSYCSKCNQLKGDGEYGCMCKDVDSMGNDPLWMNSLNEHLKNDTLLQPVNQKKFEESFSDDSIDDKEWVENAKAISSSEIKENEKVDSTKVIDSAWVNKRREGSEIKQYPVNDCFRKNDCFKAICYTPSCRFYVGGHSDAVDYTGHMNEEEKKAFHEMLEGKSKKVLTYEWHDAKTDAPERSGNYLVFEQIKQSDGNFFKRLNVECFVKDSMNYGSYWKSDVILWMDLPEVPEEFK